MNNPLKEIYYNLKETYFSPDLTAIKNFDTYDAQRFMPYLVIGLCIGIFAAVCIMYYNHEYLGRVVRKLYKAGAFSPETAKSLTEMGCNKYLIRKNLMRDTVLSKYVKPTSEINSEKDAYEALYYIPEDDKYIADKRFKKVKGGMLTVIITFFICLFGCFSLMFLIPQILQFADNLISVIKG
ncbi:MAG: hypothetical protein E7598_04640 [Ruminococcaceae bacterium]|nr:hypothetical protein [Oscillospiraceae bacterium]